MKIFNVAQIRDLDQVTIEKEPISSLDLMERAAQAITHYINLKHPAADHHFLIFCGQGNNGGDGLAVARMLMQVGALVTVITVGQGRRTSDNKTNFDRLPKNVLATVNAIPTLSKPGVIIDALFGIGLNRPVVGSYQDMIEVINALTYPVLAIDVPSGLHGDRLPGEGAIVEADLVLTLTSPKLSFFFAESLRYVPQFEVIDIGLHQGAMQSTSTKSYLVDEQQVASLLHRRPSAAHKGTFGHCLTVAGSKGKIGASILSTKAALRSGAGLATLHLPSDYASAVHAALPEAMLVLDKEKQHMSHVGNLDGYASVAMGCGLGQHQQTEHGLFQMLKEVTQPCIIDADALNSIARHSWWGHLPKESILTPHPGEFRRMFGNTSNSFEAWQLQINRSQQLNCIIILKGKYTKIVLPDNTTFINPSGNAGMATAGSGDVLTGILNGLCARGYCTREAALLGTYLHGLAGDIAVKTIGQESLIASDIIAHIPQAFKIIENS